MTINIHAYGVHHSATGSKNHDETLKLAAQKLESGFLAEMLKSAGFGKPLGEFGGGVGEDQFGSFIRQAQADEMVKAGGIGLAESFFNALKDSQYETV